MEKVKEDLVVVIPCYNAVQFCKKVFEEVLGFADIIILVDDASTDGSSKIMQNFKNKHDNVRLIAFKNNQGKGAALNAAFHYALKVLDFEVLATIDCDGQHEAKEIPQLAKAIFDGADMAIGTREFNKMPFRSRFGNSTILKLLKGIYGNAPKDTQSGFRALSKECVGKLVKVLDDGRYETEFDAILYLLDWNKVIYDHPIETIYIEKNRFSHFSPIRDSLRVLNVICKHLVQRWFGEKAA